MRVKAEVRALRVPHLAEGEVRNPTRLFVEVYDASYRQHSMVYGSMTPPPSLLLSRGRGPALLRGIFKETDPVYATDKGYCVRDVIEDLVSHMGEQALPSGGLALLEHATETPLVESQRLTEAGFGVLLLKGSLYWKGVFPSVVLVVDNHQGVGHAMGWGYIADLNGDFTMSDEDIPSMRVGMPRQALIPRKDMSGAFRQAVAVMNSSRREEDPRERLDAALAHLAASQLRTKLTMPVQATRAEQALVTAWNARERNPLRPSRGFVRLQPGAAAVLAGLSAMAESGPRLEVLDFRRPIGKGKESYKVSFTGYTADTQVPADEQALWSASLCYAYAVAEAAARPVKKLYLPPSGIPLPHEPDYARLGAERRDAELKALETPCVVVLCAPSASQTAHFGDLCYAASQRSAPGAVQIMVVNWVGDDEHHANPGTVLHGGSGPNAYTASKSRDGETVVIIPRLGLRGAGYAHIGSTLPSQAPGGYQLCSAGDWRAHAGSSGSTLRPVPTIPVTWEKMAAPQVLPPEPQRPPQDVTIAPGAEGAWDDDDDSEPPSSPSSVPSHIGRAPPPPPLRLNEAADLVAMGFPAVENGGQSPAPTSVGPRVRHKPYQRREGSVRSASSCLSEPIFPALVRPHKTVPPPVLPKVLWHFVGPDGYHSGPGAEFRAGAGAVGMPPAAAVYLSTLAHKSVCGKLPAARYNVVTAGFLEQNRVNLDSGHAPLTENDRLLMLASVETFYSFVVAHKANGAVRDAPRFARWAGHAGFTAWSSSLGLLGRMAASAARKFYRFTNALSCIPGLEGSTAAIRERHNATRVIGESVCPRHLHTGKMRALPVATFAAARAVLRDHTRDQVHMVALTVPPPSAYAGCDEPPRLTYSLGPYLDEGAQAGPGCACAAFHTFSERCLKGVNSGLRTSAAAVDEVLLVARGAIRDTYANQHMRVRDKLLEEPLTPEDVQRIPKFYAKLLDLVLPNWVYMLRGPSVAEVLVKLELAFKDARGRLFINADARAQLCAFGLNQAIMAAMKVVQLNPVSHACAGDAIHTCGLNREELREKFQAACDAGLFFVALSDASAFEAMQTQSFMDMGDELLVAVTDVLKDVFCDVALNQQIDEVARLTASSECHTMTYKDKRGLGARSFSVMAKGYFETGGGMTTAKNSVEMAAVVVTAAARVDEPCQMSVAGDDVAVCYGNLDSCSAFCTEIDALAGDLALKLTTDYGDMRDPSKPVIYNQRHYVAWDGRVYSFQNPTRSMRRLGRAINPNCAQPAYARGHAKAYLCSFATEYSGVPILHAWVSAGLAHYAGVSPVFDRDSAYWYGIQNIGRPVDQQTAKRLARGRTQTCRPPSSDERQAFAFAFGIEESEQEAYEALLTSAWTSQDWELSSSDFHFLDDVDKPSK